MPRRKRKMKGKGTPTLSQINTGNTNIKTIKS